MIHAKDLFPLALDRIHDQIKRGHAPQTAKARALMDAFDEGEKRGKREGRKAADRETIRVKREEKRARAKQLTLNLK